eukprot:3707248-Amphidinium_carterae.1
MHVWPVLGFIQPRLEKQELLMNRCVNLVSCSCAAISTSRAASSADWSFAPRAVLAEAHPK